MIARYWGYCASCGLCASGGKMRGIIGGSSCEVSWVLDGIKMMKRKRKRTNVGVFI